MRPSFPAHISIPVENYRTGEMYSLRPISAIEESAKVLEVIVSICNQSKIYTWLFESIFQGRDYEVPDAQKLFETGKTGWKNNDKFVFLLIASDGLPAACIDIKSSNLEYAEVGYWSSSEHSGVMTNTLLELVKLAKSANYRKLFGRSRKENIESSKVLFRSGFKMNQKKSGDCETYDYYELEL